MATEIKLGDTVKDRISTYMGTVTARCDRLFGGTTQFEVQSKILHDEKTQEVWFDSSQLEVVDVAAR